MRCCLLITEMWPEENSKLITLKTVIECLGSDVIKKVMTTEVN